MNRVILSPKAKADLSTIWDYTLGEWGVEQAEKYVWELWAAMQSMALDASASSDIGDIRKGYRKIRSGSHVIFFKLTDDGIDVVRILHQRMDFDRHLR
ncbi:MAG: type II toxin-antitoxin system RelE/ParE family toxin [Desulfuromonas sp.]|nr:MAG: type II toxin-antitoxin system RelE/ParE family toxin [Desulfuromonas sp.]